MSNQKKQLSTLEKCRQQLTLKRRRFCEEYVATGSGKQSALAAGFSENTATGQAGNLLKMQPVIDYIDQLRIKQQHRTDCDADKVIEEFAKIGFSNIKNYYKKGVLIKLEDLPDDIAAAIHSIKETEYKGKDDTVKVVREFKLYDKQTALKELAEHFDVYKKGGQDKEQEVQVSVTINREKNSGN